jgi:hypothetical protein
MSQITILQLWILKSKFIDLLNELEHIASAYENRVGDPKMIEESFKNTFVKWGDVLVYFVDIYIAKRKNDTPWGPFHGKLIVSARDFAKPIVGKGSILNL